MTDRIKYVCHCNNCGDEFWIDKTDANEVKCPTCKEITPLIVKGTACRVDDNLTSILFCPSCGKEIKCPSPS